MTYIIPEMVHTPEMLAGGIRRLDWREASNIDYGFYIFTNGDKKLYYIRYPNMKPNRSGVLIAASQFWTETYEAFKDTQYEAECLAGMLGS